MFSKYALLSPSDSSTVAIRCDRREAFTFEGNNMADSERQMDRRVASYLLDLHGPLMYGRSLWAALGYPSAQAFRRAVRTGSVPIRTFTLEHRRGRYAKTLDVADWLANLAAADRIEPLKD